MSFKSADLLGSLWPQLSLLDMIYLIQLNWQVLMSYKDKCSRLMELKPTLLFPCCASLTHVRLISLIKENKCLRLPACNSIKFVCVCVCVWEAISLDFPLYNLSLLAQNVPWCWMGMTANCSWSKTAEHLPCWQRPGHVITLNKGARPLII